MITKNAQNILDFWFNESLPEELFRQKDCFDKKIKKLSVSKNVPFNQIKVAGAFYGSLSHKQKLKIPKVTK